ncbi:zinc finger protein 665 isoform X5 [Bactrocera dorsalis]|uniref:Zinc finger protein 665 isoform X5 n=1 Tax=Bactrocera dorsalis TaxID=27457 RepID=A0ABM3JEU4_BACDO|nr:zinc finger protein 665 isoform X5 [Bactrocera dorsalis]
MFNETCCLLCLESSKDQIDLNCKQGIGLNGREVIELHFKEELDMMSQIEIKFICRKCWDLVETFHKFYEHVKQVHQEAANTLKSVTLEEEILEIEEEIINNDDAQIEPKRRRGRPKRQRGAETVEVFCETSIPFKECQVKIEELILPASMSPKDICNQSEIVSEVLEVKDESLLVKSQRHQAVHTGKMRKLIKCDLCESTLTTKRGLARHIKTMHTEEYQTPQVCPMCSKVSPSVMAHRKHIRDVHTLEKKHLCNLCDKAFKRHADFKDHMATHTGEALYTCSFCPQTFKSKANMYSHRKKKHPKEWAEQCELKKSVGVLLNQRGAETVKVFCETSIPFKECQVKIEELILPASMSPKDICNQSEIVSEVLEVKDESLLVKCMDDSMSTFSSDYEESESENEEDKQTKRKSRKINKRKGVNKKTAEFDEYIAKKNFKFTCCICQTSLENFKHLNRHFREVHQTRGYVLCCGKKLTERGLLIDHIHLHENPDYFKCKHCGMRMTKRRNLELHLRYKHASCLKQHYKIKDTENQKSIPCLECDKTFSYDIELRKHMRLTHSKVYAKICDICGVSVKGCDALKRHQAVHTGKMRKLIKCDLCDSTLTTKYGLARHIKTMHTEEYQTPQVCPMCSKVSPSVMAHRKHIRDVHSLEKKHLCNLCDKAFKRHGDFKDHMATHTGEALYTCSFCPQTFKSKANMYSHRKKKHSKEWAEQCELKKSVGVLLSQTVTTD